MNIVKESLIVSSFESCIAANLANIISSTRYKTGSEAVILVSLGTGCLNVKYFILKVA